MRLMIAAGCLLASLSTSPAQTPEDWANLSKRGVNAMIDCYERESFHALEARADFDSYMTTVKELCKSQRELFVETMGISRLLKADPYRMLKEVEGRRRRTLVGLAVSRSGKPFLTYASEL